MTEQIETSIDDPLAVEIAAPPVPEHQLLRLIGAGSSGEVWLARNALGTYRAVKIVRRKAFEHERPFHREFNGLLQFEPVSRLHDGLVDILQVGVNESLGFFYCVMELADDVSSGRTVVPELYAPRTLASDLLRRRRLPVCECVRTGGAIASALGFLHRQHLIHRDIKPSNIIFVNGFPKLADVGLVAASTEPTAHIGTEGFFPPEGGGTPQADVYSLGKVLYQMSTGKDRNEYPELPQDLGDDVEDKDLVKFNKIVLRACRTKPTQRFRSAEELLTALLSFQFSTAEEHRATARRRLSLRIGYACLLAGLGFVGFLVWRLVSLLNQEP